MLSVAALENRTVRITEGASLDIVLVSARTHLSYAFNHGLLVTRVPGVGIRPCQSVGGDHPLLLESGEASCEDSLADERHRHPLLESLDPRPLSGAFLASLVHDLFEKRRAVVVFELEDIRSNLNQERVELCKAVDVP